MGKSSTTHHRWKRPHVGVIGDTCELPDGRQGVLVEYGVLDKTGGWYRSLDVYTHAKVLVGNLEGDFTEVYIPIPGLERLGTTLFYR